MIINIQMSIYSSDLYSFIYFMRSFRSFFGRKLANENIIIEWMIIGTKLYSVFRLILNHAAHEHWSFRIEPADIERVIFGGKLSAGTHFPL